VQRSPQEADSVSSKVTVELTVKPLKTGEKVGTSEHNKNGPEQRRGGKREMRDRPGYTPKNGEIEQV
jgi:hypothetical protein